MCESAEVPVRGNAQTLFFNTSPNLAEKFRFYVIHRSFKCWSIDTQSII